MKKQLWITGLTAGTLMTALLSANSAKAERWIEIGVSDSYGQPECVDADSISTDDKGITKFHLQSCNAKGIAPQWWAADCSQQIPGPHGDFEMYIYSNLSHDWFGTYTRQPNSIAVVRFVCSKVR